MEEKKEEKEDKPEKNKYRLMPVVKRLLKEERKQGRGNLGKKAVYTAAAAVYPFMAVFLPKIAIGILEEERQNTEELLIIAMAAYLCAAAFIGYCMQRVKYSIEGENMRLRLRYIEALGKKIMNMDYKYVEDAGFWDKNHMAMNAGNSNTNGIEGMYNRIYTIPSKALALVGMTALSVGLSPLVFVSLIIHVAVIMCISVMNNRYRYNRKEERSKLERRVSYYYKTTHDFTFGKDIRIYNFRDRILKNYQAETESLKHFISRLAGHEFLLNLIGIATLLITNVTMYGILIYEAVNGMPISSFTMYISLITTLMASMLSFGEDITFLQNESQYVGDFFRLIDEELEDKRNEELKIDDTLEIVFDHVDFKYPGSDIYIYKDLNFKINRGEKLAVVGVNGAGKSTLVKLMTGLFEPTAGHIYINGRDINSFGKRQLYRLYSAVFQDVNILAFSIRDNVTGGRSNDIIDNNDDSRVEEALKRVGLWKKVEGFENGLDQMMLKVIDENGTDFSGGERQKLSIARGLYKDSPMVIMDEPTAALDALAEAEIYESFSNMVEGKTAVYISHRLASTKFCDKIALFDKTGLREYGSHEELMELKGEYYHMFTVQGKYYQNA